jgi:hypothetical protein
MKIETECGATIWRGFFGVNELGDQDECTGVIIEEVDDERELWEPSKDGGWIGPVTVTCPACGYLLEWPQVWYEVDGNQR